MTISTTITAKTEVIDRASGPRGALLVGVAPRMRSNPLQFVTQVAKEFGHIARLDLGTGNLFMLNHPNLVQHVLHDNASNYRKSRFYEKLGPFFGRGLITSNGPTWRRQRHVSQPAFSGPNLKAMTADIVAVCDDMLCRWQALRGPQDIAREMMYLTLRVALKTLFSATLSDNDVGRLHGALTTVLRVAEKRLWSVTNLPEVIPSPENCRFRSAVKVIDEIVYGIINDRRRDGEERPDLLTLLLSSRDEDGQPFTDKSLRDQISSVLIAGHESGASALTWMWCLLSRYPGAERRLRAEIADVLQGRNPTFDDLTKLTYAKMVFDETMRLYPPIWTMSREAVEDDEIDGYYVPAGTAVMTCPFAMHRDARFWENPEGFDPERFSPGQDKERPRFSYFPFGGGDRMCIGNRFAVMEGLVIISMVTQRFGLHLVPGHIVEAEPMISLRPRYGMVMTLHENPCG